MITHRIYRRPFNPANPAAKDIRTLVAQFPASAETEANILFRYLQEQSTSFNTEAKSPLQNYRYTLKVTTISEAKKILAQLQVDTSQAKPTPRPIKYNLSWHTKGNDCEILAFHERYGAIRAIIEDSVEARQAFVRKIGRVWPNASIISK